MTYEPTKSWLITCRRCKTTATLTGTTDHLDKLMFRKDVCHCGEPCLSAVEGQLK